MMHFNSFHLSPSAVSLKFLSIIDNLCCFCYSSTVIFLHNTNRLFSPGNPDDFGFIMPKKAIQKSAIPAETIASRIYFVRGQKVMLDRDLAELYGVQAKVLKQAVRRNINRFPFDFMFELTKEELEDWRSQFVTSKSDKMGLR